MMAADGADREIFLIFFNEDHLCAGRAFVPQIAFSLALSHEGKRVADAA
jgi:hypothetical protein